MFEFTIAHNLEEEVQVKELFREKRIGLHWREVRSVGKTHPKYSAYQKQRKIFETMSKEGAAVVASYKQATHHQPSLRLIGRVKPGTPIENDYLEWLQLEDVDLVDSSKCFLGNIAPRQCTIQSCDNRTKGRLADLVQGKPPTRNVESLHHLDMEVLITNYLMIKNICQCVWQGGRSYPDIDHIGLMKNGKELFAQTTVSEHSHLIDKKIETLKTYADTNRELYFFGPKKYKREDIENVIYKTNEEVFDYLESNQGKWLIDRMIPSKENIRVKSND